MSPVQGFTRYRKHQFGRQSSFGTPVAAVKAYPFQGVPSIDLAWTDREVDQGSLDPIVAPIRGASDLTASLNDPGVEYNSLPLMFAAIFGGSVDGVPEVGGTSVAWSWAPASTTVDEPDVFTYEFGDDVTDDWDQLSDGLLESLELAGPEGLGPFTAAMSWRFGHYGSTGSTDAGETGTVPTPSLDLDTNGVILYLKDLGIYIASSTAGLSGGQVTDALQSLTLRVSGDLDQKRFANGDQSFDVDAYGRATRLIELEAMFAKTSDTVGTGSESDAWTSDAAVTRYVELKAESTELASTTPDVPYSMDLVMPLRYYTREDGEVGGNTAITLTGHAFYDPDDLDGVFTADVVCTLAAADL
jgi:hypothetical protein